MPPQVCDVFGLGQCSLDYIGEIGSYPGADEKCEFTDMVIQGGGPVATALTALSRWGFSCSMSGVVGSDSFGSVILSSLRSEGIDTSGIMVRRDCASQFAFIACEPDTGRRTIFWRRPTGLPLLPDEINYNTIERARVVHTDGLFIDAALAACQCARKAGIPVTVDGGTLRDGMLELARYSDCFIVSETFSRALIGDDNPGETCRMLSQLGPRVVGVTRGSRGYVAMFDGKTVERPAYAVDVIDTTGCGDVFHAGITFGLIKKWNIEKSFDFAAWAAAMVSRKMGGREGIPTVEQIHEKGY